MTVPTRMKDRLEWFITSCACHESRLLRVGVTALDQRHMLNQRHTLNQRCIFTERCKNIDNNNALFYKNRDFCKIARRSVGLIYTSDLDPWFRPLV